MNINDITMITDVEYFFQLQFGDIVHTLALVHLFSPLDQEVLEALNHATYICQHGGIDSFTVVDVKLISAVVAMVPNYEVTVKGNIIVSDNRFAMVEAPFLQMATLCETLGDDNDAIDDAIN